MDYYINDVVSFSDKGFEKLDRLSLKSSEVSEIHDVSSEYLQGKGLRYVPRTVRMMQNVVGEMLEKNNLIPNKNRVGIYNTNDVCALEAAEDFDTEVENYGTRLANPMKVPYTISGATAGWIAIRNSLNNVILTINSGRCGVLSALNMAGLDFMDREVDDAIVLSANYMGEVYRRYNISSSFNKEVTVGLLASRESNVKSLVKVLETHVMTYDKLSLVKMMEQESDYMILDTDLDISLDSSLPVHHIKSTSTQMSCLPFFIDNVNVIVDKGQGKVCSYFIVDKNGLMGNMKFKIL